MVQWKLRRHISRNRQQYQCITLNDNDILCTCRGHLQYNLMCSADSNGTGLLIACYIGYSYINYDLPWSEHDSGCN